MNGARAENIYEDKKNSYYVGRKNESVRRIANNSNFSDHKKINLPNWKGYLHQCLSNLKENNIYIHIHTYAIELCSGKVDLRICGYVIC